MAAGARARLRHPAGQLRLRAAGTAVLGSALLGIAIGLLAHELTSGRSSAALPVSARYGLEGQATWRAGTRPAPQITTLHDQNGQAFSLRSLHGRTVALAFFDSHCHQSCPLEGRALARAESVLPVAQRPVVVAVSINQADSEQSVRAAMRAWGLDRLAPWHWLMGSRARLAAVWSAYHIYVARPVSGDIAHTEALYLIDRFGDERSAFIYPFGARFVGHDLEALAADAGGRR